MRGIPVNVPLCTPCRIANIVVQTNSCPGNVVGRGIDRNELQIFTGPRNTKLPSIQEISDHSDGKPTSPRSNILEQFLPAVIR